MTECYSQSDRRHLLTDWGAVSYDTALLHLVDEGLASLSNAEISSLVGALRWIGEDQPAGRPGRRSTRRRQRGYKRVPDGLLVWVGLARVVHGTNAVPLALGQVRTALSSIAQALRVAPAVVYRARVYRLDTAANLVVSRRPSAYLRSLVYVPRATRDMPTPHSLLFTNGQRQLAFYDKLAQLVETKQGVPKALQDLHLLRYELRLTGGLGREIAPPVPGSRLIAQDLAEAAVYRRAVTVWRERFETVETQLTPDINEPRDVRSLVRNLAAAQVAAVGAPALIEAVYALHADGLTSTDMRRKQRDKVLALAASAPSTDSLVAELQAAVDRAAALSLP